MSIREFDVREVIRGVEKSILCDTIIKKLRVRAECAIGLLDHGGSSGELSVIAGVGEDGGMPVSFTEMSQGVRGVDPNHHRVRRDRVGDLGGVCDNVSICSSVKRDPRGSLTWAKTIWPARRGG